MKLYKKAKSAIAMLVAVAMMLSVMPIQAVALSASPHTHPVCGKTHTDIGDHTGACAEIEWMPVSTQSELAAMEDSKSYYLANNITVDSMIMLNTITIDLCLNGNVLKYENANTTGTVIRVYKGTLNLCDCSGNNRGTITGGTGPNLGGGGGIDVDSGVFNMYSGSITGNAVGAKNGGGVYVGGTFNMYGGVIAENTAGVGGGVYVNGGLPAGTFKMYGGSITGNNGFSGGGVRNDNQFYVAGAPVISGNTETDTKVSNVELGSSDVITVGTLTDGADIGVTLYSSTGTGVFTSGGAEYADKGYFKSDDSNYVVAVDGNNLKLQEKAMPHSYPVCGDSSCSDNAHAANDSWTAWDGTTAFPEGNVYLSDDVILSASISIADTVNLCLNGHTISAAGGNFDVSGTLNLCSCKDNGIIKRTTTTNALISADAGATANLYNVTLDGGAVWSGVEDGVLLRGTTNAGTETGSPLIDAGYQHTAGGHITLNSGVVLQNNECSNAGNGGAVTIGEDGTLAINGATIRNNAKTDGNAGAIKAYAGAQITLSSGEIYGNAAYKHGGAFQIFGGESTDYADAVFTMNGGTIRNNKAAGVGGGIAVSNYAQFIMNGGSIIDNATTDSQNRGGGVGFADANTAMSISGNAIISRNSANNLYIGENPCNKLTVGTLGSDANIGVTMKISSGGVFTSGGAAYADKFTSDNSSFEVAVDGNDLKLTVPHTHNYTYSANQNVITESCSCGHSETATLNAPSGVVVYDGVEKKATVSYSENWKGGNLTVTHNNNINAGNLSASANISINGATAEIYWTILAAKPLYNIPAGLTATYGETLANVTLPTVANGTWTWENSQTSVGNVGSRTFKAIFTPNDDNNYITEVVEVPVTVNKADPQYTIPTGITAIYGEILADVTLPSGWSWYDSLTTSVGDVGTKSFAGVFTPTDAENYKTVKADITVTVNKADSTCTEPTAKLNLVYNGDAMELINAGSATGGEMQYALGTNGTTAPASNWSTATPTGKSAGTYYVWYKVVGDSNHEDMAPACVEVTINKAPLTVTANNKTITYGDAPANSGVTYAGFVSNETTDVLGGTLGYDYSYTQYGNVGDYEITPKGLTSDNYEITFQKGVLTVEQREISILWGATEFIPYNGSKRLPEVTAGSLVNGDACQLTAEVVETTEGAGIIPGRWNARITALSNGNYCLPKDGRLVEIDYSISKGYQGAPTVSGIAETVKGKADGKITGLTTEMEFSTEYTADDDKYTKVTDPNMTFAPGTYYVRYQAKGYYNPSTFTEVTIGEGRKLTVTLPQNQNGYTLTVDKTALDWQEEITLTYTLKEEYTETSAFAIKVNGSPITLTNGKYTVTNPEKDIAITVEGVRDEIPPAVEIDVKGNKWNSFWNGITFGLFFKETQDVTITATDAGSGIKSIEYYLASGELERDEVKAMTEWQIYNDTFEIDLGESYVVYAKVADKAGNIVYVNSNGIVLDATAPTLEGIENSRTYYGDLTVIKPENQRGDIKSVTLDGSAMRFAEGTYGLIRADNGTHTVIVEDYAGNKTTYTVTVMKLYTVTYKADGKVVKTEQVGHGKDATAPAIPAKDGYNETAPAWDKDGKNITADTVITAIYTKNDPGEYEVFAPETNAGGSKLTGSTEEVKKEVPFTAEEQEQVAHGADVDIWLEVVDISDTIPEGDKALVEKKLDGSTVGMYLDVSMFKQVGSSDAVKLTKLNGKVTVSFRLPISLINTDKNVERSYCIVRVHDGVAEIITPKHDARANTLAFDTDRFSTYAVTYSDVKKTDTPPTGDGFRYLLWTALLIVSGACTAGIILSDKKRKTVK